MAHSTNTPYAISLTDDLIEGLWEWSNGKFYFAQQLICSHMEYNSIYVLLSVFLFYILIFLNSR